ncbi:hypothetical protein DFH09DRAFT_1320601 [Mycena vulgaris]|nr:hypothetical protein DFH09DRAFT_1320601 [Mycena vulgaris]
MQTFTAPGTESSPSVPAAAPTQSHGDNVAALQNMLSAIQTYNQIFQPFLSLISAPAAAAPSPAGTPVPATPAPAPAIPTPAAPAPAGGFLTRGPWVAGSLYQVVPTAPLMLIAEDEMTDEDTGWYSITHGLYVSVTVSSALALGGVSGVSRSSMKRLKTQALAVAHFNEALGYRLVAVLQ